MTRIPLLTSALLITLSFVPLAMAGPLPEIELVDPPCIGLPVGDCIGVSRDCIGARDSYVGGHNCYGVSPDCVGSYWEGSDPECIGLGSIQH